MPSSFSNRSRRTSTSSPTSSESASSNSVNGMTPSDLYPTSTSTSRGRISKIRPLTMLPSRKSGRSEEHTSELQSRSDLVCRLLLEKKKNTILLLVIYTTLAAFVWRASVALLHVVRAPVVVNCTWVLLGVRVHACLFPIRLCLYCAH